jgi:Asp/Glu/hydantoin racemase
VADNIPRIVLIHALRLSIDPVAKAFASGWSEAETVNLLDDSLSRDRDNEGRMTPAMMRRIKNLMAYGIDIGASGILFSCSAFGEAIEAARESVDIPVLKPNEAMFEMAMEMGTRIGLLATFRPSISSMQEEFHQMVKSNGLSNTLETAWVRDALDALRRGEEQTHDQLIAQSAAKLSSCDAIMLAQFSMARAASAVARAVNCPVLTTPVSAVEKLKHLIDEAHQSLPQGQCR